MKYDWGFILLHVSFIFLIVIFYYIYKQKNRSQLTLAFLGLLSASMIWTFGYLGLFYCYYIFKISVNMFVNIVLTGIILTSLGIFFVGYLFAHTKIFFTLRFKLLFILPIVSLILVYTNKYHNLFYSYFSAENPLYRIFGPWFVVHSIYSYILIFAGLWNLLSFSIKNAGFFSNQSKLIFLGMLFPLSINILITLKIGNLPYYFESISFSLAVICFMFAIFKFKFLNITPIALQLIIDRISDGFLVVNDEYQIVDFNSSIVTTFKDIIAIHRNINLGRIMEKVNLGPDNGSVLDLIEIAKKEEKSISYNKHIFDNDFDKYFTIEITPIISRSLYLGTIMLFKDTTENVKAIATIEEKHAIMLEQERLASLGQLIGGIAHNLKTPIMSIAGAVEGLRDLIFEYEQSIGDKSVSSEDHHEIVAEMRMWLDKIKPYCSYMTDVINTVKGQTIQSSSSSSFGFTINELIKRIELLLKYELIRYNCKLNTAINVDINMEFYGDVNSLVQVFDNIIVNAIQAYGGKNGQIDMTVDNKENDILFTVKDYAKGIPERIKNRLLKEMVTTKGKNGTGLGLYMSSSTIKGRFGGKMWFESETGKGTTFFIQLPHKKSSA